MTIMAIDETIEIFDNCWWHYFGDLWLATEFYRINFQQSIIYKKLPQMSSENVINLSLTKNVNYIIWFWN